MSRTSFKSRSNKRSKLQIFEDVLRVIAEGEYKPTRIMYRSNLSWSPLKKILENMINLGLVEEKIVKSHRYFFITSKGEEFLECMDKLKSVLVPGPFVRNVELDSLLFSSTRTIEDQRILSVNSLEAVKPKISVG